MSQQIDALHFQEVQHVDKDPVFRQLVAVASVKVDDTHFGDDVIGEVTSGNFSPMLEQGIAMAFLPPEIAEGDTVHIEARRDLLEARVVPMPFLG